MKPFEFRLKGYLKIKGFAEKLAWNSVLAQEAKVISIQSSIHKIELMIKDIRQSLSQIGIKQGENAVWAQENSEVISGLQKKIAYLQKDMQSETSILHKLIAKHTEAKKEMKIIELYEKRQYSIYKKERKVFEDKKMDEITHNYLLRRRKNESV